MSGSAQVIANMYSWAALKRAGCEGVGRVTGANMQNYARTNCRWNSGPPNTGNARAGLNGGCFWENIEVLKCYIAHSMWYGIFLELAHDRRFAILEEARDKSAQDFYNGIKKIMGI